MTGRRIVRVSLFLLSFALGAALLVYLISKQGLDGVYDSVMSFGFWPFMGFVFLSFLNFIFYSIRWRIIINRHLPKKSHISLWKVYWDRLGGFAMSYLTPAAQVGGEPVRIALLSAEKDVTVKKATSSVVLDIAFELSAYVIFILAGVALAVFEGLGDSNSFLIILTGLGLTLAILMAFFFFVSRGKGFFGPIFHFLRFDKVKRFKKMLKATLETEEMMRDFLRKSPGLVVLVSLLSILVISFRIIEVFYIAYFFDVYLNFAQAFLVATLPGIALILPVPAGVGVFEGGFAMVFGILTIPLHAVAFALVIRSRDVVFIIAGSIHILQKGSVFLQNKVIKPMLGNGGS